MTTDLEIFRAPLPEQMRYAQALAQAATLPKAYRDRPGDVLLAFAYAQSLGIYPAQVFTGIHIIDGRPSMSAELMGGLIRRAGHLLRMSGDRQSATVEIVRHDDPDFKYRATFSIEDARDAGLLTKENWRKYPAAMLIARALSACARQACADVLSGMAYSPEELGSEIVDADELEAQRAVSHLKRISPSTVDEDPSPAVSAPPLADSAAHPEQTTQPKRKRRTKAEMEAARSETTVNLPEAELAGDPDGEERQERDVAEANEEEWVNAWLVDLDQAIEAKDLAAIGVLGSKASAGNRRDLVAQARDAWTEIQAASA